MGPALEVVDEGAEGDAGKQPDLRRRSGAGLKRAAPKRREYETGGAGAARICKGRGSEAARNLAQAEGGRDLAAVSAEAARACARVRTGAISRPSVGELIQGTKRTRGFRAAPDARRPGGGGGGGGG